MIAIFVIHSRHEIERRIETRMNTELLAELTVTLVACVVEESKESIVQIEEMIVEVHISGG